MKATKRFEWVIERLCGEKPPNEILSGTTEELRKWVASKVPEGVYANDVIDAAYLIGYGT